MLAYKVLYELANNYEQDVTQVGETYYFPTESL